MPLRPHRALLATYLRPESRRVALLALLLIAGIAVQLANPQIVRAFIDHAQAGESAGRLVWIALLFLAVALLTQAAGVAEAYVAHDLGWRTTNALRADLARHVLELDVSFHARHAPGELMERIDGDVSAIAGFFSRFVVEVVGNGLFVLGALALLFREDSRVGALITLFSLGALAFILRQGGLVAVRARAAREAAADLTAYAEERLIGLPDIKTSGADEHAMRHLHVHFAARFHCARDSAMATALFSGAVSAIFTLGTGAALALGAGLVGGGVITLGTVYVLFRYTGMLRQPLQRLTRQMNDLQQATGAIVRVRELLDEGPAIADTGQSVLPPGALSVELDRVSFAYGSASVLRDVTFRLEPREVLGLLGRTGSGKTTISRLLFRLYDPGEGAVRVGGADVRSLRLAMLHERVALVTQDVQILGGTLRDNVALFDRHVSDARLREVFEALGLQAWLHALPDGLETRIGAGGRGVSAGEAQLIALSRAFLKDPGLVILDEASSRLDPATERLLERAVTLLLRDRTGVVIAHRVATVERCDRIVILEGGCVAEAGARADLASDPASQFARLLRLGMAEVLE